MRERLKIDRREAEKEKRSSTGQAMVSSIHRRRLRNQDDGINPRDYATLEEYRHALYRSISPEMYEYLVERAKKRMRMNNPGDACEREADEMAERIVRTGDADLKRKKSVMDGIYKRKTDPIVLSIPTSSETVTNTLGAGKPLSESERSYFEPRFGADFSNVRIHDDPSSHEMAEQLNARAFTIGNDIVFNKGEYSPETHEGRKLEAHELVHVAQQSKDHEYIQRSVVASQIEQLQTEYSITDAMVLNMTATQKRISALRRAPILQSILTELGDIRVLIATMAATIIILLALTGTVAGLVAAAGLLVVGLGVSIPQFIRGVIRFIDYWNVSGSARTVNEVNHASQLLGESVGAMTVGGLFTLLALYGGFREIGRLRASRITFRGEYSQIYSLRLQDTLIQFRRVGIDVTEHGLNAYLGRLRRGVTFEGVVDTYRTGLKYFDPEYNTYIRLKNKIAVSIDIRTGRIINIQTQNNPSPRWIRRDW